MNATLRALLESEHAHLDNLLARALVEDGALDEGAFATFRAGLLRHIGMEEKVLLPLARVRQGGDPLPVAARLTADHAAFATLLVPRPTPAIVRALRRRLAEHNPLEEGEAGMYAQVARLLEPGEESSLVADLARFPEVKVAAYSDHPRAVARARELTDHPASDPPSNSGGSS